MKKLFAILLALCLVLSVAALAEGDTRLTIKEGITFGMSQSDLIAALGGAKYEVDKEHTHGGITFSVVEVENKTVNGLPSDIEYLFLNDELVAIHVDYEDGSGVYDEVKATVSGAYGESVELDLAELGNAIFAADDDGKLEGKTEAWHNSNAVIILEKDSDGDVDVYLIDLSVDYSK